MCLALVNHKEEAASVKVLPVYTGLRPIHSMCAPTLTLLQRARGAAGRSIQQRHDSVDLLAGCSPGSSFPLCRIMLTLIKGQKLNGRYDGYHPVPLP